MYTTPVVITGGGITGIAAALFLAQQGVDFILIEKHKGTSIHPRSRTIDIRTMEVFRSLGLSDALREGGKSLAPAWGIIKGDNLVHALETTTSNIIGKANVISQMEALKELAKKSPETICRCTQDISEAIMYEETKKSGLDLRFYHQLLDVDTKDNHVILRVKDRASDEEYTIKADYMIAADGANSAIREQLRIPVTGSRSWTDLLNIYLEADLEFLVKGREFSQLLIQTPEITGFLLSINNKDKWAFHLRYYPEQGEKPAAYTAERLIGILHKVLGIPDIKIKILSVLPWQLTVRIAAYFQVGNIFLAGDAAHTMTPYAGKGANTGIQDVHNLAWKLAIVLQKKAGTQLLNTYNTERQPIGAFYATLSGELADKNGFVNEALMMTKGDKLMGLPDYNYISTAVINDGSDPIEPFAGVPGTCIPHMWLDEEKQTSSLDLIRGEFVLIVNEDNSHWKNACALVKEKSGVTIYLKTFSHLHLLKQWKSITHTDDKDALLIRPDDFVAARLSSLDSVEQLWDCMQRILN